MLRLRRARRWDDGARVDVVLDRGRVTAVGPDAPGGRGGLEIDLGGRVLLPGLVNGHDHLDFSTFRALGRPPYPDLYAWAADLDAGRGDPRAAAALAVPVRERLFLGGLRSLLAGATALVHHGPLARAPGPRFPVRVLERYAYAHSPGLEPDFPGSHRRARGRIWMIHAAEGTSPRSAGEIAALEKAGALDARTVLVHAIALGPGAIARLAAAGAAVVWCPESNRRLYGATAPVAALRRAGVRLGLGSDSPVSGVRDALSNLALARREGVFGDGELLELATRRTAELFGLPCGELVPGAPADFLATGAPEGLLAGERSAVSLVLVRGEPRYGLPELMDPRRATPVTVDGHPRSLETGLARRAARILARHPRAVGADWLAGVQIPA